MLLVQILQWMLKVVNQRLLSFAKLERIDSEYSYSKPNSENNVLETLVLTLARLKSIRYPLLVLQENRKFPGLMSLWNTPCKHATELLFLISKPKHHVTQGKMHLCIVVHHITSSIVFLLAYGDLQEPWTCSSHTTEAGKCSLPSSAPVGKPKKKKKILSRHKNSMATLNYKIVKQLSLPQACHVRHALAQSNQNIHYWKSLHILSQNSFPWDNINISYFYICS